MSGFECPECEFKTTSRSSIRPHVRIEHEGEDAPYELTHCDWCSAPIYAHESQVKERSTCSRACASKQNQAKGQYGLGDNYGPRWRKIREEVRLDHCDTCGDSPDEERHAYSVNLFGHDAMS